MNREEDRRLRSLAKQADRFGIDRIEDDLYDQNDSFVEYVVPNGTPSEVEYEGKVQENYSSIQIRFDFDLDWEYDSGTYIAGDGGPGGWYEQPGNYIDKVNFYNTTPVFMFDGEEISKELYQQLNQLTDEDLDAIIGWCIVHAEGFAEDDIMDNPDRYSSD